MDLHSQDRAQMNMIDSCSVGQTIEQIYKSAKSITANSMHRESSTSYSDAQQNLFRHFPNPSNYFNLLNSTMVPGVPRINAIEQMLPLGASTSARNDISSSWKNDPRFLAAKNHLNLSSKYQQILAKPPFTVAPLRTDDSLHFHNSFPEKSLLEEKFLRRSHSYNAPEEKELPPAFGKDFENGLFYQKHSNPQRYPNIGNFPRQLPFTQTFDERSSSNNPSSLVFKRSRLEQDEDYRKSLRYESAAKFPHQSTASAKMADDRHAYPASTTPQFTSPVDLVIKQLENVSGQLRSPTLVPQASTSGFSERAFGSRSPSLSDSSMPRVSPFVEKIKSPDSLAGELEGNLSQERRSSNYSQDTSCSDDSYQSSSYVSPPDNSFLFAHHDNFGITPERARDPNIIGEPPDLIRIGDDYDDDYDDDDDDDYYSDEDIETVVDPKEIELLQRAQPDLTNATACEILEKIELLPLKFHEPNEDDLKKFLNPEEIGHINYLIKCHADAIFTIAIPSTDLDTKVISPLDYLDIHVNGVLQIFFILFKCEDFLNFTISDQISLLERGILPALISLGLPMYNCETKSWSIPSALEESSCYSLHLNDLLQIIPKPVVMNIIALQETSKKLDIDWTMAMLMLLIFVYTPTESDVIEIDRIDKLRDKYVQMLLKYTKWRCGIRNAALLFPELLKFMDAIFRLCQEIIMYQLRLSDEEVKALKTRLSSMNLSSYYNSPTGPQQNCQAIFEGEVTYMALHSQLCKLLLCAMRECEPLSNQHQLSKKLSCGASSHDDSGTLEAMPNNYAFPNRLYEPFRNTELLSEPNASDRR